MSEIISLMMIRENLDNIPQHTLPVGFSIRNFVRGEGEIWAKVNADADVFASIDEAVSRFNKEFAESVDEMESRCFFIVDDASDRAVGTAMAWYGADFDGELCGRVHFVAIVPEYQGRGLAKPLITAVLNRMAESHDKAILATQAFRHAAINLYLNFGFKPNCFQSTCPEAWRQLAKDLGHTALTQYAD